MVLNEDSHNRSDETNGGRSSAPAKSRRNRAAQVQVFLVEEFDGILIVVGGVAATLAGVFPPLSAALIPAAVTAVVGMGFRLFRVRYQLTEVQASLSERIKLTTTSVVSEVESVRGSVDSLSATILSEKLHEAEKCNRARFYEHMLEAIEHAESAVDLTQLDWRAPKNIGTPQMVRYFDRQIEIVKERPNLTFRRIIAVPSLDKLSWLLDTLELTHPFANFHIRLIDLSSSSSLPSPLSLQIFDDKEMCLVDPRLSYMDPSQKQDSMLWVRGRDVVSVFAIYYDQMWDRSTSLKDAGIVYYDVLASLLKELRAQNPNEVELADEVRERLLRMSGKVDLGI